MEGTWISRMPHLLLLGLMLFISGLQAEAEEEQMCLVKGKNLTVICPYIVKYSSSLKGWQRLKSQGPPETLVLTDTRNEDFNWAQAGRYLLEDYPTEAIMKVTVTGLQMQDEGLYQCVIRQSPENFVVQYHPIRLVQCLGDEQGDPVEESLLQPNGGLDPHLLEGFFDDDASIN